MTIIVSNNENTEEIRNYVIDIVPFGHTFFIYNLNFLATLNIEEWTFIS